MAASYVLLQVVFPLELFLQLVLAADKTPVSAVAVSRSMPEENVSTGVGLGAIWFRTPPGFVEALSCMLIER